MSDDLGMGNPDIFGVSTVTSLDGWKSITKNHKNENRSAYLVGQRWLESSGDFPPAIKRAMTPLDTLRGLRPVFSVAEHITVLDTLTAPSRTDLMVYCQDGKCGKAVVAVEGKVDEAFDERIVYWIRDERHRNRQNLEELLTLKINKGKQRRLKWLCHHLNLSLDDQSMIRYQLLHRTADALLEAKHVGARLAIMLVQSFTECSENWNDYAEFATLMGFSSIASNSISEAKALPEFPEIRLHLGWVYDLSEERG